MKCKIVAHGIECESMKETGLNYCEIHSNLTSRHYFCECLVEQPTAILTEHNHEEKDICKGHTHNPVAYCHFHKVQALHYMCSCIVTVDEINTSEEIGMDVKAWEILEQGAKTFKEKAKVYGENYKIVGKILLLLLGGINITQQHHWDRVHLITMIVVKLTRYCLNFDKGHQDSIHDMMVYCAMLEEIDNSE